MVKKLLYTWTSRKGLVDWGVHEDNGLTDIISSDPSILSDYNTCKANMESFLDILSSTNLKLHIMIPQFKDAQNNSISPGNVDHRTTIANASGQLIEDVPGLEGLSFDDYWYTGATTQNLIDFADVVGNAVHDAKEECLFSAGTSYGTMTGQGYTVADVDPSFDFVMPEIYRIYSQSHEWFRNWLDNCLANSVDRNTVYPLIITYHDPPTNTPYSNEEIQRDINIVLSRKLQGYALFSEAYNHLTGFEFPGKFTRETVERTPVISRDMVSRTQRI